MTITGVLETTKKLTTLTEDYFNICDEDIQEALERDPTAPYWDIDMKRKSWVWCFTRGRGGGKSTGMTFFAAREMALNNTRVVSNYPIEFIYAPEGRPAYPLRAETLDLYKLMVKDLMAGKKVTINALLRADDLRDFLGELKASDIELMVVVTKAVGSNGVSLHYQASSRFEACGLLYAGLRQLEEEGLE